MKTREEKRSIQKKRAKTSQTRYGDSLKENVIDLDTARKGSTRVAETLSSKIINDPGCAANSEEEEEEEDKIKKRQGCLEAAARHAQSIKKSLQKSDKRLIAPGTREFEELTRPEKAKWHLDRARQLFWAGQALIEKAFALGKTIETRDTIDTESSLSSQREWKRVKTMMNQGKAMHYSVMEECSPKKLCELGVHAKCSESNNCEKRGKERDEDPDSKKRRQYEDGIKLFATDAPLSQQPVPEGTSACKELFLGYALLREYEMNPSPPLMLVKDEQSQEVVLQPNPVRLKEDEVYGKIMGTFRMLPNRLGVGERARNVCVQAAKTVSDNFLDENSLDFILKQGRYSPFDENEQDEENLLEEDKEEEIKDDNEYLHCNLYFQVREDDVYGPCMVKAAFALQEKLQGSPETRKQILETLASRERKRGKSEKTEKKEKKEKEKKIKRKDLEALGLDPKKFQVWTDYSRALYELHTQFPPAPLDYDPNDARVDEDENNIPLSMEFYENKSQEEKNRVIMGSPHQLLSLKENWQGALYTEADDYDCKRAYRFRKTPPYAVPGATSLWSWYYHFGVIPSSRSDMVVPNVKAGLAMSVLYPTGCSIDQIKAKGVKLPLLLRMPSSEKNIMIEMGLPTGNCWDARVAASFLMTKERHLKNLVQRYVVDETKEHIHGNRRMNPGGYEPGLDKGLPSSLSGLPMWPRGPTFDVNAETGFFDGMLGPGDGGGGGVSLAQKRSILQKVDFLAEKNLNQRRNTPHKSLSLAYPSEALDDIEREDENLKNFVSTAVQKRYDDEKNEKEGKEWFSMAADRDSLHKNKNGDGQQQPPSFQKAQRRGPELFFSTTLPEKEKTKRYVAMLNHALYQLGAPTTPWMVVKLHASLSFSNKEEKEKETEKEKEKEKGKNEPGSGQFANPVQPRHFSSFAANSSHFKKGWAFMNMADRFPYFIDFVPFRDRNHEEKMEKEEEKIEEEDEYQYSLFNMPRKESEKRERVNTRAFTKTAPAKRSDDFLIWGAPIGPMILDELFGEPGHRPVLDPDYDPSESETSHFGVWVAQTNQKRVLGTLTFGLDFYAF